MRIILFLTIVFAAYSCNSKVNDDCEKAKASLKLISDMNAIYEETNRKLESENEQLKKYLSRCASPKESPNEAPVQKSNNDFNSVGNGFSVRKIKIDISNSTLNLIGEMKNETGKSYQVANFIFGLYDEQDNLLGSGIINISNFADDSTKIFRSIADAPDRKVDSVKIQFENGI